MTEEQLRSMTEQEIRRRFRCAPAYYLQAKLEKKRALEGGRPAVCEGEAPRGKATLEPARRRSERAPSRELTAPPKPRRRAPAPRVVERLAPAPLPGFEILDAALAESGSLDTAAPPPADSDSDLDALMESPLDAALTQQAILEAALEDYANWPLRSAPEALAPTEPTSELERKLALVLDADPELRRALDEEPELEVVLESEPALNRALDAEIGFSADNVTLAAFGQRPPRTVPVVSVVMDRKRPNMVRVVGHSTRLAS